MDEFNYNHDNTEENSEEKKEENRYSAGYSERSFSDSAYARSGYRNTNPENRYENAGSVYGSANSENRYENAGSVYGSANSENRYDNVGPGYGTANSENRYENAGAGYGSENRYSADRSYMDEKPSRRKKEKREKKSGNGMFKKIVACVALGALFGACAAGSFYAVNKYLLKDAAPVATETNADVAKLQETVASLQKVINTNSTGTATTVVTDVTDVVKKVMPSMVAVNNVGNEVYTDWFGRRYEQETESCGSGIIVGESDTEYFIATNHHVIDGAIKLSVLFADDTSADAFVKGYDSSMDIAVIGVSKENLSNETIAAIKVAEIGDSDALSIGEPAIAIGNALGYGQSVTTGVVSALHRDMSIENSTYSNLIQTSAAINPGNSGGALLNISGQVIGINSSKVGGDAIEGMGFAIPINEVYEIIGEFSARETRNKVSDDEKGYLGIGSNNSYDLTSLGYPAGVYVQKVYENSPAKAAGIFMGDIITKCNGQSVSTISELSDYLSYYKSGETVKLTVTRNVSGELTELTIDVVLGTKDAISE